jgi:molybdopterin adenylyltransferase
VSRRAAEDLAGPTLAAAAESAGCRVDAMEVVPDDYSLIEDRLNHFVDAGFEVILTTGGTGLTQDDLTPDATRAVIDREVPGIAEAMRAESRNHTPHGMLSRAVAGAAGRTLIVNLPGSPRAVEQLMVVLGPVLPHAVATLGGSGGHRSH